MIIGTTLQPEVYFCVQGVFEDIRKGQLQCEMSLNAHENNVKSPWTEYRRFQGIGHMEEMAEPRSKGRAGNIHREDKCQQAHLLVQDKGHKWKKLMAQWVKNPPEMQET